MRAQSCPALCNPMGCSLSGSSVHGVFQARILEWVAISPSGDLLDLGIEPSFPASPALAGGFFTTEPPGKAMLRYARAISRDRKFGVSLTSPWASSTKVSLCWQDVSDQNSMDYPQLYKPGQLNLLFNKHEFFICMAHGIYTSLALFFIPYGAFYNMAGDDGQQTADYQSFAVTMATSLVIVVSVQVTLLVKIS